MKSDKLYRRLLRKQTQILMMLTKEVDGFSSEKNRIERGEAVPGELRSLNLSITRGDLRLQFWGGYSDEGSGCVYAELCTVLMFLGLKDAHVSPMLGFRYHCFETPGFWVPELEIVTKTEEPGDCRIVSDLAEELDNIYRLTEDGCLIRETIDEETALNTLKRLARYFVERSA